MIDRGGTSEIAASSSSRSNIDSGRRASRRLARASVISTMTCPGQEGERPRNAGAARNGRSGRGSDGAAGRVSFAESVTSPGARRMSPRGPTAEINQASVAGFDHLDRLTDDRVAVAGFPLEELAIDHGYPAPNVADCTRSLER